MLKSKVQREGATISEPGTDLTSSGLGAWVMIQLFQKVHTWKKFFKAFKTQRSPTSHSHLSTGLHNPCSCKYLAWQCANSQSGRVTLSVGSLQAASQLSQNKLQFKYAYCLTKRWCWTLLTKSSAKVNSNSWRAITLGTCQVLLVPTEFRQFRELAFTTLTWMNSLGSSIMHLAVS